MHNISYENLLESLFDGVYFVDLNRTISYWNKAAERITGYHRSEVLGSRCSDNILRHVDERGGELCVVGCPLAQTMKDGKVRTANVYLHHKGGHRVPVSVRVSPVWENGIIIGGVEIFSDKYDLLEVLNQLKRLKDEAYLDELTRVGNRRFCKMTLHTRLYELKAFAVPFGVLFFDLDQFKRFNDTYGHQTGDQILCMVGRTVSNILRKLDTVSRWGGEEFVVTLAHIDEANLEEVAHRIRIFIERSFLLVGSEKLSITVSVGATMATHDDDAGSIMRRADELMFASKNSGGNRVTVG
jgi:diguanylate cyclase (GGDEF)-like protein/PAS domain S-box-containing protein